MIIWVDAQLPPTLAAWLVKTFGVIAFSLKELGLRDAKDTEIFEAANHHTSHRFRNSLAFPANRSFHCAQFGKYLRCLDGGC
jgi:hypothetical protein